MADGEPQAYLAFDPATQTGWCSYEHLGPSRPPRVMTGFFKGYKGGTEAQFFCSISLQIKDTILRVRPKAIAIEQTPSSQASIEVPVRGDMFGGKKKMSIRTDRNTKVQEGIRAIILAHVGASRPSLGFPNGIPYEEVHVNTWRKKFIGVAKAPLMRPANMSSSKWLQTECMKRAKELGELFDFEVANKDVVSAVGIAWWMAATRGHREALQAFVGA